MLLPGRLGGVRRVAVGHDRHVPEGRAFVALINLNAENEYKVTMRAHKSAAQ